MFYLCDKVINNRDCMYISDNLSSMQNIGSKFLVGIQETSTAVNYIYLFHNTFSSTLFQILYCHFHPEISHTFQ